MFSWYCKNEKCPSAESCARNIVHHKSITIITGGDLIDVELDGKDKCTKYAGIKMIEQISKFDDYVNINGENTRESRDACIDMIRETVAHLQENTDEKITNEIALTSLLL